MTASKITSVVGQGNRGAIISVPWWPDKPGQGGWELTQGWGVTDVSLEPPGHGYKFWHAGADVGVDAGTIISLPTEIIQGYVKRVLNPGGYGVAAVLTLSTSNRPGSAQAGAKGVDIWFGHCAQVLADGWIRGGDHIAASNNTGNSSGPHVHFEVRPMGGAYGTDVDPSAWLLDPVKAAADAGIPTASSGTDPVTAAIEAAFAPVAASIDTAAQEFVAAAVGTAQVGLGSVMMLGGLGIVTLGMRGQSVGQGVSSARRFVAGRQAAAARATYTRERQTQGAIAADQAQQASAAREAGRQAAAMRRQTMGSYRAGLISRAEAQRRLGEPVRPTGRRPRRVAFAGGGFRSPGVYRTRGGGSVQVQRAARVRASRVKGMKLPPLPAAVPASEPPF